METVFKQKEVTEKLKFHNSLFERDIEFEIMGQNVDRSYEDRSVYLNIKHGDSRIQDWLNGEDAITLGLSLIKHGQFALQANMVNHQLIHQRRKLDQYINEDRVSVLIFEVVDKKPVNYGEGFMTFKIKPVWVEGEEPEYDEDFEYEQVIYLYELGTERSNKQLERFHKNKCCIMFLHNPERRKCECCEEKWTI